MADTIKKVDYYKIETANRAGEGARILGALKEAGVNLIAFTGFPRGRRTQLDFIPEDGAAFRKAMKKAGVAASKKKTGFLVQGRDKVGAIADILAKLADAGINVTALNAVTAGKGRFGAILWVKPESVAKASRALGAS
ncbi:MAG: hypothetical protein GTN70_12070 [Deltaproteobacteria bacterium]|nr:hypothetical protein [Deltaproteobacteria bacterium]NIS78508.1 hypothetical protein [Deltaproteobacteria bacterium]